MSSATAVHPTRAPMRTVLSHIVVPMIMGLVMAVAYLGGFHKPTPHELPVAVVGSSASAQQFAHGLQDKLGDAVAVTTVPDRATAIDRLQHLDLYGAYLPGKGTGELLTASGASDSARTVVEQIFSRVAFAQHVPLKVTDAAPLDSSDPIGQNAFFFMVALTVGSYATSIAIGAAGGTRRFRDRIGLALGTAVVLPSVMLLIARFGFDMFAPHLLQVWLLSMLYSAGVLLVGVGLHPVVGRFATLLYSAVFVGFNFTSSGGVFSPELQPAFYARMHDFWIGSGFIESVRRLFYFPDVSLTGPLTILAGWLVVGVLCLALGHAVERRRAKGAEPLIGAPDPMLDDETEVELEENVAV